MSYNQPRPQQSHQAPAPTIRAGLSVQELKAMTAMRMATSNDANRGYSSNTSQKFPSVNPASSYQTATPQQLQAAGIQPLVVNDRLMKARLQKQNSQPLIGAGLSHFEDVNYYSRGAQSIPDRGYSSQPQPSTLSAYHQQILTSGNKYPNVQTVKDVSKARLQGDGQFGNYDLSPIARAPMQQQQNLYQQSRAEVLQQSNSALYGRSEASSSGLRRDVVDIQPQHGLYPLQQQLAPGQLTQAEEEDLLYIQNMGSAGYGRNAPVTQQSTLRGLPPTATGRSQFSPQTQFAQMNQYGSDLSLQQQQQGRLQPMGIQQQQQQQFRNAPSLPRNAPLRPLQQQYYASDEEGDGADSSLEGLLGSYGISQQPQQQSRLGALNTGLGYLPSELLANNSNTGSQANKRAGGGMFGSAALHALDSDLDGNGSEDNSGGNDFFTAALQRESGAFSDSFTELNLIDQDVALKQSASAVQQGTRPMKLGTILKSQSQPTIPLNSQTFSAYQGYTAAAGPSMSGSGSPVPALVSSRHATMAVQGLLLPDVSSASPHTSRENTPKTLAPPGLKPSPMNGPAHISEPVTSPGQFLPQLGKSKSGRNLLGASPISSPMLFPRKNSLSLGGGINHLDDGTNGADDYFSSEMAESVLMGALGGTPQPAAGKSFLFSKDINEFRALNAAKQSPAPPQWATNTGTDGHEENDLDRSLAAVKNAPAALDYLQQPHRSNNEDETDGRVSGFLSRESSGSQGYSNSVSPRGLRE